MEDIRFGAIGAGHMGGAILRAVLDKGVFSPEDVHISSPVPDELAPFAARGCAVGADNLETVRNAGLILLVVRPNQSVAVLKEVSPLMGGKCLLSSVAGLKTDTIRSLLPPDAHVLRVMPNLPLAYGAGATVMAVPGPSVPERFVTAAKAVFGCGGIVETIDESVINAATALGGSAVAYFFRMAAVMARWAEENGVDREAALRIAAQTMTGAAAMLTGSGQSPEALANGVAVPGGTTEAAFRAFDETGFDQSLRAGMDACRDRGIQLVLPS